MKIAFIVGHFPVLSETFIINQITGLIERGHEVHIYGYQPQEVTKFHPDVEKYHLIARTHYLIPIPQNYIWRLFGALKLIVSMRKIPNRMIWRSLNFWKYGRLALSLRLLYLVMSFLDIPKYDIIHCQFGTHGLTGMTLRELGVIQGKLVTSFRGYDISSYLQKNSTRVYNKLFKSGDLFLANCEFFRNRAIKIGCPPTKITVHYSGINCQNFHFHHHPVTEKIIITSIGRLVEKKGFKYALLAIAEVANIYQNIEYNIIGDGYLKAELEKLARDLKITDKVKFWGWRTQTEIIQILDNSHILLAPSITAEDGNQDAPVNTLKEAMAMGLPVIATQHGGIPELVEDNTSGFLVREKDTSAIADRLMYLIQHPEKCQEMGKNGRKHVEKYFEIEKLNDELVRIYQQLINQPEYRDNNLILARKSSPKIIAIPNKSSL
ncbi:glycosyltransferase [Calothrix sp. 336/3]|uniref:glycosyltransferase n=1 Tax=Calothrix sp. 336/3 TaxID=1337936 RepID=UPI000624CBBB|nr:glycosyltransferase [Calothrix sp. 336/3]AKG24002.1 glycosyltransferase [Calothrix sp. 336/3]